MKTIEEMLPSVTAATLEGRIAWVADGPRYSVQIGKYKVVTWEWADEHTEASGATVSIFEGATQIDYVLADEYSPRYRMIMDFYQLARRSALNITAIIEDIERELSKLPRK